MAAQQNLIKQSDLLNRLVLDRNTMEELGHVDVLWMYPEAHRVLGFVCKSGLLGGKKVAFNLAQVQTLGADSILVNSSPVETDTSRVQQLESLIHCEVWSDAGNKIGRISDCLFQLKTGEIREYLLVSNGWSGVVGSIYQLPPKKIMSFGRKRVLVAEAAVKTLAVYRGGLQQAVAETGSFLKENYTEVAQEVRSMAEQAQTATGHLKQQWLKLTGRAKKQAQAFAAQMKEQAQTLNEQLREETQTFSEQARKQGQGFATQVKEQAQAFNEQIREETQTFSEQARKQGQGFAAQVKERAQAIGEQVQDSAQPWVEQARENAQNWTEQVQETLDPLAPKRQRRPAATRYETVPNREVERPELIPEEDLEDDAPWI